MQQANNSSQDTLQSIDPILRVNAVSKATGLAIPTIKKAVLSNSFPCPVRLGPKAIGWRTSTVMNWINDRPLATYQQNI